MARSSSAVKGDQEMDGSRTLVHRSKHPVGSLPGNSAATTVHFTCPVPYPLASSLSLLSSSGVHPARGPAGKTSTPKGTIGLGVRPLVRRGPWSGTGAAYAATSSGLALAILLKYCCACERIWTSVRDSTCVARKR